MTSWRRVHGQALFHAFAVVVWLVFPALWRPVVVAGIVAPYLVAFGLVSLAVVASGPFLFFAAGRSAPETPGRTRLRWLGLSSLVLVLETCLLVTAVLIALASRPYATEGGAMPFSPGARDLEWLLPPSEWLAVRIGAGLVTATAFATVVGLVSTWWLLPTAFRTRFFLVFDALVLAALVVATAVLPIVPPTDDDLDVARATIRLAITVLFAVRALFRVLPVALDLLERVGFRTLVAVRQLRSKKSSFLAVIGGLSVLAVSMSSCSLTTTLSVMGGFRADLKRKILGSHAHIVVDRDEDAFEGWGPLQRKIAATPGVVGVAPYATGEVMITSATNRATAVLRGVEPRSFAEVSDLEKNLVRGKLSYLEDPARLLHLPPSEIDGAKIPLLPPIDRSRRGPSEPRTTDRGPPSKPPGGGVARSLDPKQREASPLAEFPELEPVRPDVLPGIVVGQELAKSLRLYLGDEVQVVFPHGELGPTGPMPKSRPFRVAGIFYSGMYEYDMKYAYTMLASAQRFLGIGDAVHGLEVKVDQVERAPQRAAALRAALSGTNARVRDWQEMNRNLFGALALEKLAMFVTLGVAILVAGFCVFGTLTLLVQEKAREVAVLRAMGTSPEDVIGVFLIEGLLIGCLGALIGLGLGYVCVFLVEQFPFAPMNPEVYYIDRLPVNIDPVEFLLVGVAAIAVCLISTIFPAFIASRLQVVDALRFE